MHVLQYIAVKIDNAPSEIAAITLDECKEEAFDEVKYKFEDMYSESEGLGGWSDWFVVGGGRWNSDPDNQYKEQWNDVISYAEKPEEFTKAITGAIESRMREFNSYRQRFNEQNIDINTCLDKYDGTMDYSFDLYELKKMIDMVQGSWDFNSYYYDLSNYSVNPKWCLEDLDKNPELWYLVPVDFHF